jgi:hypothetical protein
MEEEKLEEFERLKKILSKSQLTEDDVQELTDEVNTALSERYKKLLNDSSF